MAAYATPRLELASRSSRREGNGIDPSTLDSSPEAHCSMLLSISWPSAWRSVSQLRRVTRRPASRTVRTSGSTRDTRPCISASIETRCASSLLSGRSLPSRTGQIASSTSGAPTSIPGGGPAGGRGIWRRRCVASRRCRSWARNRPSLVEFGSSATSTAVRPASTRLASRTEEASNGGAPSSEASRQLVPCGMRCCPSAPAASGSRTTAAYGSATPPAAGSRGRWLIFGPRRRPVTAMRLSGTCSTASALVDWTPSRPTISRTWFVNSVLTASPSPRS
jgi:hypothetical protein